MRRVGPILLVMVMVACKGKDSSPPAQIQPAAPSSAPTASTESAVAPEVNPPGDIPDTQAFIKYTSSAGGYEMDVPEGWARTESGSAVNFVNKFDGVHVAIAPVSAAPTVASARANEGKQIQSQGHAVTITSVAEVTFPAGKAILVKYTSNSDPNPVTNKRVRLENAAYIYFKNGKEATLTLWAPLGADNADQWNRMSKSFRWM